MKLEATYRLKLTAANLIGSSTYSHEHPSGDDLTQAGLVSWIRSVVQQEAGAETKSPPLLRKQKSNLGSLTLTSVKPKALINTLSQYGYKPSGNGVVMKTISGKRCVVTMDPTDDGRGSEIFVKVA